MAVASITSPQEVNQWLDEGLTYQEISGLLERRNPNVKGLSVRSVRRFCSTNDIGKKCNLSKQALSKKVIEMQLKFGDNYGRKMMYGALRSEGIRVGEKMVGSVLNEINPAATNSRRTNAGRSLNPKQYKSDYFGEKVHVDQNEKLVMYGTVHVCARDGYSGMIVGYCTMPVKNNIVIYDYLYRPLLENYGIWDQLRVDGGKEFVLISHAQELFQNYRNSKERLPFRATKSTDNHIIERIWVEVNNRVNYPLKNILNDLVSKDNIDMSNPVTKFCVSWVTCKVSYYGLGKFVDAWNSHPVPKKGRPDLLAKHNNKAGKVPANEIVSGTIMAQRYLQSKGTSIKPPEIYGIDPLEGRFDLQGLRETRYRQRFPRDGSIFENVIGGKVETFSSAICFFQNLTIDLSRAL